MAVKIPRNTPIKVKIGNLNTKYLSIYFPPKVRIVIIAAICSAMEEYLP